MDRSPDRNYRLLGCALIGMAVVMAVRLQGNPDAAPEDGGARGVAVQPISYHVSTRPAKRPRPPRSSIDPSISLRDLAMLTRAEFRDLSDRAEGPDPESELGMARAIDRIQTLRAGGLGPRHPEVQLWAYRLKHIAWPAGLTAQDIADGHAALDDE